MADKTEVIEVVSFSGVNDRNNNPAWKLTANVAWSQFPIEYLEWPRQDGEAAFQLGQYSCEFNRGNSFRNKQGSDKDWDYYWNPITMNFVGAGNNGGAPSGNGGQPANNNQPSNYQPSNGNRHSGSAASDVKKDRSMAVSYAKDLCCADKIERGEVFEVAAKILAFIEDGPEAVQEEIDWREEKEEG